MANTRKPLLVVEDIPNVLELLEVTLRFQGYEVISAHNGQEALDILEKEKPALIAPAFIVKWCWPEPLFDVSIHVRCR